MLKLSLENKIIDLPDLNRFRIGDHVIADAAFDHDRHEGIVIGIELQRVHGTRSLVLEPSITLLHDVDQITDGFSPVDLRKVEAPSPQKMVATSTPETREPVAYRHRLTGSPEWNVSNADNMDGVRECMRHLGDRLEVEPLFTAAPAPQPNLKAHTNGR